MKKLFIALSVLGACVWFSGDAGAWERSYYWSWRPGWSGPGVLFMIPIVLMFGFWIAIIIGIVFFVKWVLTSGKTHESKSGETALDILKKRYARGEISKEDFERMKQEIQ